jgi:hypothetical protein
MALAIQGKFKKLKFSKTIAQYNPVPHTVQAQSENHTERT